MHRSWRGHQHRERVQQLRPRPVDVWHHQGQSTSTVEPQERDRLVLCKDITHVCIGEDHENNPARYSDECPFLFFYNDKTHTYEGQLTCDGTDGVDGGGRRRGEEGNRAVVDEAED